MSKHVRHLRWLILAWSALLQPLLSPAASPALDTGFVSTIGVGLIPDSYPTFDSGTGATNAITLQSDGKIIAGGNDFQFS